MNIKPISSAFFTFSALLFIFSLSAQIPQEGLQGYYKLDGNDYANYSTQNSVPLDPYPTGGFLLPAQNRYGEPDMALKLINQFLDTQSDPQIYDFTTENALSLCVWMKIDETVIDWTGLLNNWAGFDIGGYYLGLTPNQEIRWNINVDPPIDSAPITTGTWVHVAATYDGNTAFLYLDGNLAAQRVYGSNLLTSVYPFTVGTQADVPNNIFPGVFDDILIYNRSLSAQEVLDIVQALSIDDLDAFERAIRLGPNPTLGPLQMTYDTSFGRLTQLDIYDLKGALMSRKTLTEPENVFDISSYASGVYTFEFTTADGQKVQKKIIKK
jgi:hypothetical protein